jgi:hypothetical protein
VKIYIGGYYMLQTALGEIIISINGKEINYTAEELSNSEKCFFVDKRYKIAIDDIEGKNEETSIECKLINANGLILETGKESGEDLELISIYYNNTKLSIGVEGELPHIEYEYIDTGLRITVPTHASSQQFIFGIAWLTMNDVETEDIYTWFAADPTLKI